MPATKNVQPLYLLRLKSQGISEANPATTAPIPTATSKEGNAQQSKVETEVNKEPILTKSSFILVNILVFLKLKTDIKKKEQQLGHSL